MRTEKVAVVGEPTKITSIIDHAQNINARALYRGKDFTVEQNGPTWCYRNNDMTIDQLAQAFYSS